MPRPPLQAGRQGWEVHSSCAVDAAVLMLMLLCGSWAGKQALWLPASLPASAAAAASCSCAAVAAALA
jgi:hypothetical protein